MFCLDTYGLKERVRKSLKERWECGAILVFLLELHTLHQVPSA